MADKAPIKVVITGAAGQIGYSLIYMVSSGYVFGADQPVVLHLLDIAPMMGVLGGVVMEIADCAMPLVKDVIATDDAVKAFTVSAKDLVISSIKIYLEIKLEHILKIDNISLFNRMSTLHLWLVPCPEKKEWRGKTCWLPTSKSSRSKGKL